MFYLCRETTGVHSRQGAHDARGHLPLTLCLTMHRTLLILCFLLTLLPALRAQELEKRTLTLLDTLDSDIDHRAGYHASRDRQVAALRNDLTHAQGMARVALLKEIFHLYSHYQTDSAQVYLNRLAALPEAAQSPDLRAYIGTGQAEIWAVGGLYPEASARLQEVRQLLTGTEDHELQLFYYRTQRTLYGWMADYTAMPVPHQLYKQRAAHYRDTILTLEGPGLSHDIVLSDRDIDTGHPENAIRRLLPYARGMRPDNADAYVCFLLYQAYKATGRRDDAIYYLTLTAIADLRRGTTEYQALPLLAQTLYEHGDIKRAYDYLICSMEDANYCKATLRAIEVTKIFPIIDKQYKQQQASLRRGRIVLLVTLCVLLAILSAMVVMLRRQIRRVHSSRKALAESNAKLERTNEELARKGDALDATLNQLRQVDKVKEAYIARYLDRCRTYIDAMASRQHTLSKLCKERRYDELGKLLRDDDIIHDERERLYADFDAAFLTLFPDFIERFNALLRPGEELHPKHEGRLSTELRIYALIRLGITDTQRIAHFLSFSTATVYSYRSKMRGRAADGPEGFEARVQQL